jgi:hypothetical protein
MMWVFWPKCQQTVKCNKTFPPRGWSNRVRKWKRSRNGGSGSLTGRCWRLYFRAMLWSPSKTNLLRSWSWDDVRVQQDLCRRGDNSSSPDTVKTKGLLSQGDWEKQNTGSWEYVSWTCILLHFITPNLTTWLRRGCHERCCENKMMFHFKVSFLLKNRR